MQRRFTLIVWIAVQILDTCDFASLGLWGFAINGDRKTELNPYAIRWRVTMLCLVFTGYILAVLTAAVKAGEFLQPWAPGPVKVYSDNINYAVGVFIQIEWDADFTNATIVLTQDNHPGDARGGPSVTLEGRS